jgi:flagellar FliL protein
MRILLLLLGALAIACAGFGAGWYASIGLGHGLPDDGEEAARDEAPPPPPPSGIPVFVNIGPVTVPVLAADRVDQFVTLLVAVEVADAAAADYVRAQGPRLTDAYLTSLYGAVGSGMLIEAGLLDLEQVKERLNAASRRVLGQDAFRDVLVQVVTQRPM